MKNLWSKTLCKLGIHKKINFVNEGEVNWVLMHYEITKCTKCDKVF